MHDEAHINVKFTLLTHIKDTYHVNTKIALDSNNINLFIDKFYNMILDTQIGVTQSITYTTDFNYLINTFFLCLFKQYCLT